MSIEYWPIVGYGLKLDNIKIFNTDKLLEELVLDEDDLSLEDIADFLTSKSKFLIWCSTAQMYWDDVIYLYFPCELPWMMKEEVKKLNKEDIKNEIIKVIKPYLKSEIDIEEIREQIDYISDCGCA